MVFKSFLNTAELCAWFRLNHSVKTELWVNIFKKDSGIQSVSWNDCVVEALAWGWIDGQKKSHDSLSYLQRLTPRRSNSNWSRKNKEHAERLIAEGRMQPSGLKLVQEALSDGRWDAAYEGSATMKIPEDFLDLLSQHKNAMLFFNSLDRKNLYPIYYKLATAKNPETRARRMQKIIEQLSQANRINI